MVFYQSGSNSTPQVWTMAEANFVIKFSSTCEFHSCIDVFGAFKLGHFQFLEPISSPNFLQLVNFILAVKSVGHSNWAICTQSSQQYRESYDEIHHEFRWCGVLSWPLTKHPVIKLSL